MNFDMRFTKPPKKTTPVMGQRLKFNLVLFTVLAIFITMIVLGVHFSMKSQRKKERKENRENQRILQYKGLAKYRLLLVKTIDEMKMLVRDKVLDTKIPKEELIKHLDNFNTPIVWKMTEKEVYDTYLDMIATEGLEKVSLSKLMEYIQPLVVRRNWFTSEVVFFDAKVFIRELQIDLSYDPNEEGIPSETQNENQKETESPPVPSSMRRNNYIARRSMTPSQQMNLKKEVVDALTKKIKSNPLSK